MPGVLTNGLDIASDDAGFTPFTPAVPMTDSREHADTLVLAWVLLLYRNSAESAFTAGLHTTVDGVPSRTPTYSGYVAEYVSGWDDPVADVLARLREHRTAPPSNAVWDGTSMFFSNASAAGAQDPNSSITMDTHVAPTGTLSLRQTHAPPLTPDMTTLHLTAYTSILNTLLSTSANPTVRTTTSLSPPELSHLWSLATPLPPAHRICMHTLITARARAHPAAVAITSWDATLTYAQLDALSSRVARRLAALGVGPGVVVPVVFEKSAWCAVGVVGVMKCGAAFALVDAGQPVQRLRVVSGEVGARVVVAGSAQAGIGREMAETVVVVGEGLLAEERGEEEEEEWEVDPDETLYVIFTSGSTGTPKGIAISHASYASGAIPRAGLVGYREGSRVLDFASYAFDVSIDCMLCTLAAGGTVCVPSEAQRVNDLGGAIAAMGANMAHMTPSVARVLEPEVMARLEVLGLGGEAVSARDAAAWSERTRPVICYGPSETTVACTVNGDVAPGRTSIGKGCGGATWIVDPDDQDRLMGVGAVGELLIEGPIVGKGYINQPEKTAEVFVEDLPWLLAGADGVPGRRGRLYKTGDLVRYDSDGSGNIVFVGRKDAQVKLRGQRVELGEVEYHVQKHLPTGTGVAAEVVKPGGCEPTLVCFIATNSTPPTFSPELSKAMAGLDQELAKELPIYMLPSAYIPLEQIPKLVSMKTDRKRLRELGASLSRQQLAKLRAETATAGEQREPRTPMERSLYQLWATLFGPDAQFGVNTNFFGLGGDSLAAMKLVAAARTEGLSLTVADIFSRPRLQDMAKAMGNLDADRAQVAPFSLLPEGCELADAAELCGIEPSQIEDAYPCTPLQEGLMALSAKVKSAYVAQRVVELPDLDTAHRLRQAFNTAAADCHILRTRIVQVPGHGLIQVVVRGDMQWASSSSLEAYIAQDQEDEMSLGTALARLGVVADDTTGKASFVLTIHHALYDGWSMPLVVDRVNRAYQGQETVRLAPFRSFIHYLATIDHNTSRKYWSETLNGAGQPQFPALPAPGYQTRADSLLERYVSLPKKAASNTTVATAIRGAWALVAAQYTSNDVVFGETLTGRNANIVGVEDIEGPMITTVPLRVHINPRARAADFLQTIHRDTVRRIPHEHLGLQHIRRLHPDAREACELRTGLVMHPAAEPGDTAPRDNEPALGFMPANDVEAAREALKFNSYALMLVCSLDPQGFLIMASFDQKTLSVARAEKVLEQFEHTVQKLCEDGNALIGNIDSVAQPGSYAEHQPKPVKTVAASKIPVEQPRRDSAMHSPFATEKQLKLRRLWGRALGLPEAEIDENSNFFELGGDSIAAMKLVSEARLEGLHLTVADMFLNRDFLDMADVLKSTKSPLAPAPAVHKPFSLVDFPADVVKPQLENPDWPVVDVLPTRPLQDIAVKGTTTLPRYSARYELLHFDAPVDTARLFAACHALVAHNEILRTIFVQHASRTYGVVLSALTVPITSYTTDADLSTFTTSLCNLDILTPMPLGTPFLKFFHVTTPGPQSTLILRISHAQYDEMCLPALLTQLSALYNSTPLPPTTPFSAFVSHTLRSALPASLPYWRRLLAGSVPTVLQPPVPLTSTAPVSLVSAPISLAGRSTATTPATLPSAAWALVLARRLGLRDVVFGEVVTGRDAGGWAAVAGPTWQYVPTRVVFQPGWTGHDLLAAIQRQHLESAQHAGPGLSEIVSQATDWPAGYDWFDSVVHQDVEHVETMAFGGAGARLDTVYPHTEPLREWKVQFFRKGEEVVVEVVARESWVDVGREVLGEVEGALRELVEGPGGALFA